MPNYQNSKIYKICSYQTDDIYIGSTTQKLCKRLVGHKSRAIAYKKTGKKHTSSCELLSKFNDCYIELIIECPCDNREQLLRIEGEYIRKMNCVNKNIAGRTDAQYYQDNKEKIKEKYNPEHKKKYNKIYRETNKEKIKAHKSIKHPCKCGAYYTNGHRNRHERTKKHINKLLSL